MDIKIREALRYLGYKNNNYDEPTVQKVTALMDRLVNECNTKFIYKVVDVAVVDGVIDFGGFLVESKNLAKNLAGCKKAIVFACTIGQSADLLIRRLSVTSVADSVMINACGSSYAEEYANDCNRGLKEKYGKGLRPRFSPGYGDFDLKHQHDIVGLLNTPKEIGVTLTDSLMLIPSKSITAVIGVGESELDCVLDGCEVCDKKDCLYRRS